MRCSPWSSSSGKVKAKERRGVCWNCGESNHYSRDCPNEQQNNSWTDGGAWKNRKGSQAGKDAGKGWDAGKSNWKLVKQKKGKDWHGNGKSQERQGQNRQNDWSTPAWKGKGSTKGSSKGSICSVLLVGAVRGITVQLIIRRRNSLLHAEREQRAESTDKRYIRKKMQREDGHK